jgi:hypothetical protein
MDGRSLLENIRAAGLLLQRENTATHSLLAMPLSHTRLPNGRSLGSTDFGVLCNWLWPDKDFIFTNESLELTPLSALHGWDRRCDL